MKKSSLDGIFVLIVVISAMHFFPPLARAQPTYSPGVVAGNSVTFGSISVTWSSISNPTPPSFIQQYNQTKSIRLTVTNVAAPIVTANMTFTYKNGTSTTNTGTVNVQDGSGSFNIFILAGGLSAGYPIYQSNLYFFSPIIQETTTKLYAGALRSTNVVNVNNTYGPQANQVLLDWDAQTGFLLEVLSSASYPGQSYSIHFKATSTNVWSPSTTPNFAFDAIPQSSSLVHQGASIAFTLILNSTNSFAGTINLKSTLLNSTLPKPTLSLSRTSVRLLAGQSNSSILKFSTNSSTPLGLYLFSVNGTSGNLFHADIFAVTVSPPDFDLSAAPANLTIPVGTTKSSIITVRALGSFSGTVSLSPNFYSNLIVTLQPASVTLSQTVTSANSTLTVQVPLGTAPGPYYSVGVIGTSGSLSRSVFIPINVTGPDFRMSTSPTLLTLKQGATAQSIVTLTSILGFQGTVSLSTYSYYGGVTVSLDKNSVFLNSTRPATATLTISVAVSATPGFYYSFVNGNSANIYRQAEVALNVTGPDLRMTINPTFFTLKEGTNATSTITLTSILGLHGTVTLSAYVYNFNGPTVSLNPANLTLSANATATSKLAISTSNSVPGYYTIVVTATIGSINRYAYVNVQVTGPDFGISPSYFSLSLRQGRSSTSTLSLSRLQNFNGTITLSTSVYGPYPGGGLAASVSPANVTLSSTTTSATTNLTITASAAATLGYYTVQVIGTSGRLTHTAYVFVKVQGPDLGMTISPSFFTLQEGTNATATITLTSLLGFHGTVALTAYVYPSNGPTISLNATSLTLAANATAASKMTISTSTAVPGNYNVQVIATGGNLTRYGYIYVQVVGPDFQISSSTFSLTLPQGNSSTSTISLSRLQNFNGTITLSTSVYGPYPGGGLAASVSPTSVSLSSTITSATANLTMTASQTATAGFYTVQVYATSGRLTHAVTISVYVSLAPTFSIVATSPADFNSGASGNSTITITPSNGFAGTVTIATSTSPSPGLTPGCPTSLMVPVNGNASVTGICHPTSTTPGTYTVTITATGGGLTRNTTFTSNVGGFKIYTNTPADFNSGAAGKITVLITSTNNFSGKVTLTGTSSSTGLTVICPVVAVTLSASADISPACTLSSTTPGTYTVTIMAKGSPGSFSQSTSAVVHVGDFTISASSGSFNSGASGASITISLTSTLNFAGSVSLSAVVGPSIGLNVVCPTGAVPLTANGTSVASCTLSSASSGIYQVTLTGKGMPGTSSHDASSIIHVGDFTTSVTPTNINSGTAGSISVSLTSTNNFAGAISLSFTTFPSGLTVICPYAPSVAGNSSVTISCSATSTSPGTYSATVTGTSLTGASSHSASAVVHVGDFSISIGSPVNFNRGSPNEVISVNLTSTLNFAGTVVLAPEANPANGLTVTCPAVTLTANSSSTTYCTLNAGATGTFLVTIKGNSLPGTGSHSSSGVVQVVDFTVSTSDVSPSTIKPGGSAASSITVAPVNGFTGIVTLAVSPPSGITCSFDHTTIQSPGTSNLSCTGNTPGDYTVTITVIGGSTFHQTSLTFHVVGSAQVSASPTMFGLQVPQFYMLLGGIIVAITVAGVTAVLRRKR